MPRLVRGIVLV